MNSNSIVEFNTGKVKGLFISVPYNTIVEECHFKNKESLRFALMVCFGSKNAIPSWIPIVIPEGDYKIVGLSSQIDEKTMTENLGITWKEYIRMLNEQDITVSYSDWSNFWMVVVLN
jgi:hypothetical protein